MIVDSFNWLIIREYSEEGKIKSFDFTHCLSSIYTVSDCIDFFSYVKSLAEAKVYQDLLIGFIDFISKNKHRIILIEAYEQEPYLFVGIDINLLHSNIETSDFRFYKSILESKDIEVSKKRVHNLFNYRKTPYSQNELLLIIKILYYSSKEVCRDIVNEARDQLEEIDEKDLIKDEDLTKWNIVLVTGFMRLFKSHSLTGAEAELMYIKNKIMLIDNKKVQQALFFVLNKEKDNPQVTKVFHRLFKKFGNAINTESDIKLVEEYLKESLRKEIMFVKDLYKQAQLSMENAEKEEADLLLNEIL